MRVLAGLAVLSFAATVSAAEKPMKLRDLPPAVQKAMQEETKGAVVKGYAKETEDGKVFYEVETMRNGRARDVTFEPNGTLASIEEETTLDSIPAAAKAAIEKGAAGGRIGLVEKVTEGGEVTYEAQVTRGAKKSEVVVKPDGSPAK
jgi:uncharacterized membrane protein YkoI